MQLMAKRALVYHISTEPNRLFLTGQRIELRRDGHDSTAYRVGKKWTESHELFLNKLTVKFDHIFFVLEHVEIPVKHIVLPRV